MGGYITVMIRFSDGEILSKETWTNRISYYMQSVEFLKGNKEFIKSNAFHSEDSDYRCPSEYGLVFFDFMKKKVMSIQDYGDPSTFDLMLAICSRDKEENLNDTIKAGFVSVAHYKNYNEPSKNRTEKLGDIKNITEFFLRKYPVLLEFANHLDLDVSKLSLRDLSYLNDEYIKYVIQNPNQKGILEWCKARGIDFTEKDFDDDSKKEELASIKKQYFFDHIISTHQRLIESWSIPLDKFEYYSKLSSVLEFRKLKDYLDKEGIVFSQEENETWEKCFIKA